MKHTINWPGISSYRYGIAGEEKEFLFTHFTAYKQAKLRAKKGEVLRLSDFQTRHALRLSKLPVFEKLGDKAYRDRLKALIEERELSLANSRAKEGLSFLGRKEALAQNCFDTPITTKKSNRPLCYTRCFEAKKRFMEWYFSWWAEYKSASARLRSGIWNAIFPEHCIKPPMHYLIS